MGKRLPYTPRSMVKNALRQLWLRSRERQTALKRDKYACRHCNRKQSRAKGREFDVTVHHLDGVKWEKLIDMMYEMLLCNPDRLLTLCEECHDKVEKETP
jgi:5-methylcytosine-specific restriction endonuclease McrA